ncbi:hypothetical protein EAS56_32990 [Bradyrhizobium guangzhouense]|uniref:Uncharacterized protein n=1 Tax=Bradyrhizobium guangzhouense TaxID=1325095 RepID=A0AAE6C7F6_9BRAD|nr:hypothetical protein XH91_08135 [Bradyrhizobium guangzhouense]RXH07303.1 hypothetical protein EAS56_32990 [Bradyrhizobium guangzhouense]
MVGEAIYSETARHSRHCEEPLRRSNPDCLSGDNLDCFATLAMTGVGSGAQKSSHRYPVRDNTSTDCNPHHD